MVAEAIQARGVGSAPGPLADYRGAFERLHRVRECFGGGLCIGACQDEDRLLATIAFAVQLILRPILRGDVGRALPVVVEAGALVDKIAGK